jgi:hypothetical protein
MVAVHIAEPEVRPLKIRALNRCVPVKRSPKYRLVLLNSEQRLHLTPRPPRPIGAEHKDIPSRLPRRQATVLVSQAQGAASRSPLAAYQSDGATSRSQRAQCRPQPRQLAVTGSLLRSPGSRSTPPPIAARRLFPRPARSRLGIT